MTTIVDAGGRQRSLLAGLQDRAACGCFTLKLPIAKTQVAGADRARRAVAQATHVYVESAFGTFVKTIPEHAAEILRRDEHAATVADVMISTGGAHVFLRRPTPMENPS